MSALSQEEKVLSVKRMLIGNFNQIYSVMIKYMTDAPIDEKKREYAFVMLDQGTKLFVEAINELNFNVNEEKKNAEETKTRQESEATQEEVLVDAPQEIIEQGSYTVKCEEGTESPSKDEAKTSDCYSSECSKASKESEAA